MSNCCCAPAERKNRELKIEYLYLDLKTCDRCVGTDQLLDEVMDVLRPALEMAGFNVEYLKQEITGPELAKKYHFLSSPTVLVNGNDIFGAVVESNCGCCGEIAGTDIDCRMFPYDGKYYDMPSREMLAEAILRHINMPSRRVFPVYHLPNNLKRFFEGKAAKEQK